MSFTETVRRHAPGAIGTGVGIGIGEFIAEVMARGLNLTGVSKFGAKLVIKLIVGGLFLMGATTVVGPWSIFLVGAGYGAIGSILVDVVTLVIPGGLPAAAEAVTAGMRRTRTPARMVVRSTTPSTSKSVAKGVVSR